MLYLDTSASAKLLLAEEETGALEGYLRASSAPLLTSRVGIVELRRVARRDPVAATRADLVAAALTVIELDRTVEQIAVGLDPELRALDAIHLGSALALGGELEGFVCYDQRLAAAARAADLPVVAPGR